MAAVFLAGLVPLTTMSAAGQGLSDRSRGPLGKVPSFSLDRPGILTDTGIKIERTKADVAKAKLQISLPTFYVRGILNLCFATSNATATEDNGFPVQPACAQLFHLPLPPAYQNPNHSFVGGVVDGYAARSDGRHVVYGDLPAVKVQGIVFGSLPISATLRLSQTVTNGYIDPIRARYAVLPKLSDPTRFPPVDDTGSASYPGLPPVPAPTNGGWNITTRNSLDATLAVHLSDVRLDGKSVDVGTACTTTSPAQLRVRAPLGARPAYARQVRGLPDGFFPASDDSPDFPYHPPGYFDGTVNIPSFTHCGTGRDNLDPILTALISGPNNKVSGFIRHSVTVNFWNNVPFSKLPDSSQVQVRRKLALAQAIAAYESPATLRRLQAKMKSSDYREPAVPAVNVR